MCVIHAGLLVGDLKTLASPASVQHPKGGHPSPRQEAWSSVADWYRQECPSTGLASDRRNLFVDWWYTHYSLSVENGPVRQVHPVSEDAVSDYAAGPDDHVIPKDRTLNARGRVD